MTASRSDEWTPQEVAARETWRIALLNSLQAVLSPETLIEFLSYIDLEQNHLRRFVVIYDGLTRTKTEVFYSEKIEAIVARVLEAINEYTDRSREGTVRPQSPKD